MLAHHFISRAISGNIESVGTRIFDWPNDEVMSGEATIPYIVVKADGFTRQLATKDDEWDNFADVDSILVTVVANTDDSICDILMDIREAVNDYATNASDSDWQEMGFLIDDIDVKSNGINFDELTGARCCTLTYTIINHQY